MYFECDRIGANIVAPRKRSRDAEWETTIRTGSSGVSAYHIVIVIERCNVDRCLNYLVHYHDGAQRGSRVSCYL